MSEQLDPIIAQAITRGSAAAERVIGFRDALFEPCMGLLLHLGPDHLRACAAGVVEAVILAATRHAAGGPPIDAEIIEFAPPKAGERG